MRSLWIALAFYALAGYMFTQSKTLEVLLYTFVGSAFILMDHAIKARFNKNKKQLTVLSWIFIIGSVLLFIAVLRQDAYNL